MTTCSAIEVSYCEQVVKFICKEENTVIASDCTLAQYAQRAKHVQYIHLYEPDTSQGAGRSAIKHLGTVDYVSCMIKRLSMGKDLPCAQSGTRQLQ